MASAASSEEATHWLDKSRTQLFREHSDCPPSEEAPKVKEATFRVLACIFRDDRLLLCKRKKGDEWEIPMVSITVTPTDDLNGQLECATRRDNGDSIITTIEKLLEIDIHMDACSQAEFLEEHCETSMLQIQQRHADFPVIATLPVLLLLKVLPRNMFKDVTKYCEHQWCDEQDTVNQLLSSQSTIEEYQIRNSIFNRYDELRPKG